MNEIEALNALEQRQNAATFKADEQILGEVSEMMLTYLKGIITWDVVCEVFIKFKIEDYINRLEPVKKKKLHDIRKTHSKWDINNLV